MSKAHYNSAHYTALAANAFPEGKDSAGFNLKGVERVLDLFCAWDCLFAM